MPTTTLFPNGTQLDSSALTQGQFNLALQSIICQILGINPGILQPANTTAGSNQIVVLDSSELSVGQSVSGLGIPSGTIITAINGTTLTISNNAIQTLSGSSGYGVGGYGGGFGTVISFGSDPQAFYKVRVGWQETGQPAWQITDDICSIMATLADDPYNRIRDPQFAPNDLTSLLQTTQYTRVWTVRLVLYGPNSFDNARLIKSCLFLDWVNAQLSGSNLYIVPDISDPTRSPEEFEGQWWERSDLSFNLYEDVNEIITVQSIASAEIIAFTESEKAFDITVS